MSASFYDLLKYAKTGIASPSMTAYDKQKALAMCKAGFPVKTLTGVPPLTFKSDGTPLISWSISGNMTQTGTPAPSAPIQPQECGNLVESGEHAGQYAIPISIGGQTQNIYLSEPLRKIDDYADKVSSDWTVTRLVKKLVLTGQENIEHRSGNAKLYVPISGMKTPKSVASVEWVCSHYIPVANSATWSNYDYMISWSSGDVGASVGLRIRDINYLTGTTVSDFKAFLAAQHAAGTPVTIWYVLANPVTEQITVPTLTPAKGANVLEIGTTLQPSSVSITGKIKAT